MRTEGVDEGFGPLEQGSFAHAVLEEFYRRFQAAGHSKVNAQNLDEARSLMQVVANSAAARQIDEPPGSRYVAITEMERREVDQLCRQLVDYLDFEAELLPTFSPAYFEYKISADSPVEYAGHLLVGMVDRIDVDENGRAVFRTSAWRAGAVSNSSAFSTSPAHSISMRSTNSGLTIISCMRTRSGAMTKPANSAGIPFSADSPPSR